MISVENENVCRFYKYGYCKFLETCRYKHNDKVCDKNECDIVSCEDRHPKDCIYLKSYKYCKFGEYCKFNHLINEVKYIEVQKTKYKELVEKVTSLELKCTKYDSILEALEKKALVQAVDPSDGLSSVNTELSALNLKLKDIGEQCIIYFGAVDELEGDTKILKHQMEKLLAIRCKICSQEFQSEDLLKQHFMMHHRSTLPYRPKH